MINLPINKNTFLFDMDGTLVNTEPVGPKVLLDLFNAHEITLTREEKELFVKVWRRDGTDIKEEDYLTELASKYALNKHPLDFIQEFYENYKSEIIKAEELPGVTSFLHRATQGGKQLLLVTSSKRVQAEAILSFHHWRALFADIISEEDITRFKPDPEPYLVAAKKVKSSIENCIVFEDAKNGVTAGKLAGAYVVGLRAGNQVKQDLSGADQIVSSFEELGL